ncbi:30S ribosomal protein S4 [Patescibacteria group bacterium]|nr:30S ribosomal protein S4 [Patescibacteria group bacterium]MBU1672834.1 30S ribosomal protein S4 [Patescibacteria group bacterium]MBU1963268.1 30S ribosomal protein S4 [Patescibacteria group bacterium]
MARNTNPKCKICRRAGEKLFLKGERCDSSKCAMVKKNYPPGLHGPKGRGRVSGYGERLREKQKAKNIYGVLERQFQNYFKKASGLGGNVADNMSQLLELRLDNIVYRANFAPSRAEARQLVNHGHFKVNGKRADIASMELKLNDEITVAKKSAGNKYFEELKKTLGKADSAAWIDVNKDQISVNVKALPEAKDQKEQIQMNLIIEYYSR